MLELIQTKLSLVPEGAELLGRVLDRDDETVHDPGEEVRRDERGRRTGIGETVLTVHRTVQNYQLAHCHTVSILDDKQIRIASVHQGNCLPS